MISKSEVERNSTRLKISKEIVSDKSDVIEIWGEGGTIIEQSLWFIHLLDWLSLLKAEKKNIDVVEVKIIDYLKSELAKQ